MGILPLNCLTGAFAAVNIYFFSFPLKTDVYNDLLIFNPEKGTWKQVKAPSGPPPRSAHQAIATPANKYVLPYLTSVKIRYNQLPEARGFLESTQSLQQHHPEGV